jgi:hypothetical protein
MVSVTDENNTKQEKAAYRAAVRRTMDKLLGGAAEHSYIHVADLRAAVYGYGGSSQERVATRRQRRQAYVELGERPREPVVDSAPGRYRWMAVMR